MTVQEKVCKVHNIVMSDFIKFRCTLTIFADPFCEAPVRSIRL